MAAAGTWACWPTENNEKKPEDINHKEDKVGARFIAPSDGRNEESINRKERKGRKEEGTHHESTKSTKGLDTYSLRLRVLRAFVVKQHSSYLFG